MRLRNIDLYFLYCQISGLMITVLVLWYGGHLIKNLLMKPDIMISFVLYQFELSDCFNAIGTVYTGMHITITFIYCVLQLL